MKIIIFLFITLCYSSAFAQISVKGQLYDTENNAVSNVHIILSVEDSQKNATISQENGYFIFKKVAGGNYTLKFSCVGYQNLVMNLRINDQNVDLGKIIMLKQDVELEEITVTGKNKIRKINYEILYPDEFQKKHSANGIDLVDKLALNNVKVDLFSNEIKRFDGSDIQLCLNGKSVSNREIMALRPEEILRVEYYEHPHIRYQVPTINYVTRKIESGGVLSSQLTMSPFPAPGGTGMFSLRLNRKKSDWGMIYDGGIFSIKERYYTQQIFRLPGQSIERDMKTGPTQYKQQAHDATLIYTYREENSTNFSITANHRIDKIPLWGKDYAWHTSGSDTIQNTLDSSRIKRNKTSVKFYLEKLLKNEQTLLFDLTGTYFDDYSFSSTNYLTNQKQTNFISSLASGKKYSLFGVAGYLKNWQKSSFIAMLEYNWSAFEQNYDGTLNNGTDINQNTSKAAAKFAKGWGKWQVEVGGVLNFEQTRQKGETSNRFTYQMQISCMRQFDENSSVTYQGQVGRLSPSLYYLKDIESQTNDFLRWKGNPALKANYYYINDLTFNYGRKAFSGNLEGFWYYEPHPVMKETRFENPHFVQTYNNQKGLHIVHINANLSVSPWQNYLSLKFCPAWRYNLTRSDLYKHEYSFFYYFAEISGYYKNWILRTQIYNSFHFLEGEDLIKNPVHDDITILYKYKNWMFTAGIANFLGRRYKNNQIENLSALAPEKSCSTLIKNKVYFRVSFSLPWGQQREAIEQKIQTKDEGDGLAK